MSALTGLRGLAAIWVFAFHASRVAPLSFPAAGFAQRLVAAGWSGVDLFFLLSGFVLMHAHGEQFRRSPLAAVPGFFVSRFWRIYPLNAVVVALIGLYIAASPAFGLQMQSEFNGSYTAQTAWRTLTLSTRWFGGMRGEWNEPTWSLSAEMIGYALFPLIAFLAMRAERWPTSLIGFLLCFIALFDALSLFGVAGDNAYQNIPCVARMAFEFAAGIFLYRTRLNTPPGAQRYASWVGWLSLVLIFWLVGQGSLTLIPIGCAGLIWALSFTSRDLLARLFQSRVSDFFGKISFPLYLTHLMTFRWLLHVTDGFGVTDPLFRGTAEIAAIAIIVGLSWLLHEAIERPSIGLARRSNKIRGSTAAVMLGWPAVA